MPKIDFAAQSRVPVAGSHKLPFQPGAESKPVRGSGSITVSVVVRRKNQLNANALGEQRLTRAQYKAQHSADPAAVKAVVSFAKAFSLTSATPTDARRTVHLTGTIANMQKAFNVTLKQQAGPDGTTYRVREGEIYIPESLNGMVEAVLGLDNRPQADTHFRIAKDTPVNEGAAAPRGAAGVVNPRATGTSYTPVQVAQLYGLPSGSTAKGQTIGIIELGGGYKTADITAYFKSLGVAAPTVTAVLVDGGKNKSDGPNGADGEVMLDIEVAGAVASGAKIVVYFAPNTDQGFIDAIATAVHDTANKPSVISISWGGPESSWTAQSITALDQACQSAAALGVTILAASGDNGSGDGVTDGKNHVDFPASSPHVLACGGTKLTGSSGKITAEVVWNETAANEGATGGGISTSFPQPSWQSTITATKAGRGVPDVSGNADPTTGYQVRVDGGSYVIGGTSAVAPLWAGLLAVVNAKAKTTGGFVQPKLYAATAASAFRDITSGNNGAFKAAKGWDACTGLGSPNVANLLTLLAPAKTTTKPTKGTKTAQSQ